MHVRGGERGTGKSFNAARMWVGWEVAKYDEYYNKIEKSETHLSKDLFFRDHFFLGSKIKNTEIVSKWRPLFSLHRIFNLLRVPFNFKTFEVFHWQKSLETTAMDYRFKIEFKIAGVAFWEYGKSPTWSRFLHMLESNWEILRV